MSSQQRGSQLTHEEALLAKYGLSPQQIQESNGSSVIPHFPEILAIIDDGITYSLIQRVLVARKLFSWFSVKTGKKNKNDDNDNSGPGDDSDDKQTRQDTETDKLFQQYYAKILEIIKFLIVLPDDRPRNNLRAIKEGEAGEEEEEEHPVQESLTSQKPAYYLSLLLENYCDDFPDFKEIIQNELMKILYFILSKHVSLKEREETIGKRGRREEEEGESSSITRNETMKLLLKCLPPVGKWNQIMTLFLFVFIQTSFQIQLTDLCLSFSLSLLFFIADNEEELTTMTNIFTETIKQCDRGNDPSNNHDNPNDQKEEKEKEKNSDDKDTKQQDPSPDISSQRTKDALPEKCDGGPSLREECFHRLHHISLVKSEAHPSLFENHFEFLLSTVKQTGQKTAFQICRTVNPRYFHEDNDKFLQSFHLFIQNISVDHFEGMIERLIDKAEQKIKNLFSSVAELVKQLASAAVKTRLLLLSLFLSFVQITVSVLVPFLEAVVSGSLFDSILLIPCCKILAVMGRTSPELAVSCLKSLVRLAKSEWTTTSSDHHHHHLSSERGSAGGELAEKNQSAILEAINIVKDGSQYCGLFSPATLTLLEGFSRYNRTAYENILTWHEGKSARIGDHQQFLINPGRIVSEEEAEAERRKRNSLFYFYVLPVVSYFSSSSSSSSGPTASSSSSSSSSANSNNKNKNSAVISPSPHSQNLALLNDNNNSNNNNNNNTSGLNPGNNSTVANPNSDDITTITNTATIAAPLAEEGEEGRRRRNPEQPTTIKEQEGDNNNTTTITIIDKDSSDNDNGNNTTSNNSNNNNSQQTTTDLNNDSNNKKSSNGEENNMKSNNNNMEDNDKADDENNENNSNNRENRGLVSPAATQAEEKNNDDDKNNKNSQEERDSHKNNSNNAVTSAPTVTVANNQEPMAIEDQRKGREELSGPETTVPVPFDENEALHEIPVHSHHGPSLLGKLFSSSANRPKSASVGIAPPEQNNNNTHSNGANNSKAVVPSVNNNNNMMQSTSAHHLPPEKETSDNNSNSISNTTHHNNNHYKNKVIPVSSSQPNTVTAPVK
jgi:hypothetical protein